jgi:hypothetical protein
MSGALSAALVMNRRPAIKPAAIAIFRITCRDTLHPMVTLPPALFSLQLQSRMA